jgi:hypothetical protein
MKNFRAFALAALVLVAIVATYFIAFARPTPVAPQPSTQSRTDLKYTYLIDVAGWYEITPNESAVASPYDFSIAGLKEMPRQIGQWAGEPIALGEAVDVWFENPDLAVSSYYRDDKGNQLWFSAFGSKSRKSYVLFEHTPATSYPAAGWTLASSGIVVVPIEARKISVQHAWLQLGKEKRLALFWYLWNDFSRDPEKGVLTMRLHIPVVTTDEAARAAGEDFLRAIFPQVVPWRRF